jgi:hypothetical protein
MTEVQQSKRQISVAVDAQLRRQLELAAKLAERSVSGECAFRLRQSFEAETASTG